MFLAQVHEIIRPNLEALGLKSVVRCCLRGFGHVAKPYTCRVCVREVAKTSAFEDECFLGVVM